MKTEEQLEHARHRTRTLWLVGTLHAFTHLYTVALLPLYLQIRNDFGLSSVEHATLLVTVLGLAYVIPSYPIGILADRFSRKKLLALGLAVNAVGFLMLGFAPNYAVAMIAVVVAGLGGSFYHPSGTALVARLCPEGRGRALGLVGIGAGAGFFFGPLYCGWRASASGSWRTPVLEIGLLGLVAAALFLWLAEEERAPSSADAEHHSSPSPPRSLFPSARLWLCFLGATLILTSRDFAGQAMGTGASLFLQKAHGYGTKAAGLTLSAVFIMSAISNPLFGHLSDRGRLRWATLVLVCGAILAAAIPWLSLSGVVPAFLAYGFFFMASYPIIEASLMESVPDAVRARVFGLFMTIGGLIGNLSHWVVGRWVEHLGVRAGSPSGYYSLFGILGVMIIASVLAFPLLHALRKGRFEPQTAHSRDQQKLELE